MHTTYSNPQNFREGDWVSVTSSNMIDDALVLCACAETNAPHTENDFELLRYILQYLVFLNSYSAKFVAAMMAGRCCITLCMLAVLANTGTKTIQNL